MCNASLSKISVVISNALITSLFGTSKSGSLYITNTSNGLDFTGGANVVNSKGEDNTDTGTNWTGNKEYQSARTPYILSQTINGTRYNLFRVIIYKDI